MLLEKDGPTRPAENILIPTAASSEVKREIENFCESLRKKEADKLGFIPAIAYEQAVEKGRLVIELENDSPCGFIFFGGRKKTLRIYQTAIVEDARRIKHATQLVAALLSQPFARGKTELKLRVAHDLPANFFWQSIGCRVEQQQPGGYTWRRTINVYRMPLRKKIKIAEKFIEANLNASRVGLALPEELDKDVWRRRKDRAMRERNPSSRLPNERD